MSEITGKLLNILDSEPELGSIVVALCGYGNQVPRYATTGALVARATSIDVDAGSGGAFSIDVPGNDKIAPPTTYYTITVKDDNGDVIQVNAYVFLESDNYDLSTALPFDPTLPMMPLPPLIIDEINVVPASDTMTFDGSDLTTFKTVLHSNVLHATWPNMVPGNLYTFIILQDATGGWQFSWGATVHNGTMIKQNPNGQTVQTFVADVDGQLYAISGGAYS
jgi:hypothetical protein